jgi:hypothetical protein
MPGVPAAIPVDGDSVRNLHLLVRCVVLAAFGDRAFLYHVPDGYKPLEAR